MKLNAILDIEIVAVESEDHVSALLELTAPEVAKTEQRPRSTFEVVLDRSGSMAGERLDTAKLALDALVGRLDPADNFGLVVFDDEVIAAVPAGPIGDKHFVRQLIGAIFPGGTTNLSGGLMRGIQEARRVQAEQSATLVLLSDGHANVGLVEPEELERAAALASRNGIVTSTIGVGLGYDERLMTAIARGGAGNTHFAEEADAAGAAVASEVEHLLDQALQATNLTVRFGPDVEYARLVNDVPCVPLPDGFVAELGDFYSGETRKLLLEIDVPAMSELGLAQVAELELRYVEVGSLEAQTVTMPLHVNVVPGDAAAGRVPNPTVRSELAFQKAQRAKQDAAERLREGDASGAADHFTSAASLLDAEIQSGAGEMADELRAEAQVLRELSVRATTDDASRVAKFSEADRHRKDRKRGRR